MSPPVRSCQRAPALAACDAHLRRTALIAAVAGFIDVERRLGARTLTEVLARSDAELLALDPSGRAAAVIARFDAAAARRELERTGLQAVCRCMGDHPAHARTAALPDPPAALHSTSDAALRDALARPTVGIVGARRGSLYGLEVARRLACDLARSGVTVVSGMAMGVDSAAHEGALAGAGLTIAVLGGGADQPYPQRARGLFRRIIREGCVVSELPPGFRALPWCFPARNRIIAALSDMVVVVEGAERSGSLITAELALNLGRPVGAVPGLVTSRLADGTNALLHDGATPVRHAQDVLDAITDGWIAPPPPAHTRVAPPLPPELARLLGRIDAGASTAAQLAGSPGEVSAVLAGLAQLERRGLIARHPGGGYVCTA